MLRLPFLFNVYHDAGTYKMYAYTVVKVAYWDMAEYDSAWMLDEALPPGQVLVPSVNVTEESFQFDSEKEALDWIKDWWKKRK